MEEDVWIWNSCRSNSTYSVNNCYGENNKEYGEAMDECIDSENNYWIFIVYSVDTQNSTGDWQTA